jgi:secreted PhoX family phosphatase
VSEQIESQVISRRKLFLLAGLAAGFAAPGAVLATSNAEAQQPEAQQPSADPTKKTKKKKKAAPTGSAPVPSPSEKAQ